MVRTAFVSNWIKVGVILLGCVAALLAYPQFISHQNSKCTERAMGDFTLIVVSQTRWSLSEGCEYLVKYRSSDSPYEWKSQYIFDFMTD